MTWAAATTHSTMTIWIPLQRINNHVMSVPTVFIWRSAEERLGRRSGCARTKSVRQISGRANGSRLLGFLYQLFQRVHLVARRNQIVRTSILLHACAAISAAAFHSRTPTFSWL